MRKKLWRYLNPMAHLGERHYSTRFPLFIGLISFFILEVIGNFLLKHPNDMGMAAVTLAFLLVLYFSFRCGLRGGLITSVVSIIYFSYFLYSRNVPVIQKEEAIVNVVILGFLFFLIAFIVGGLKKTIDNLFWKEQQARRSAEHEQRRWETLMEQLPVGVIIAQAPHGEVIGYNKNAIKLIGHKVRPVSSIEEYGSFHAYARGKQMTSEDWPLARALIAGKTVTGEEISFKRKGKDVTLFMNAAPVCDEEGSIIAAVSTFYDISKQKELERQKDDFIAIASHELRTPLTSTKMYSQILLKELADNPKAAMLLKKLNGQVDKLTSLVLTMLDTTQIEKGKLVMQEETFILQDVALETFADLQRITDRKLSIDWRTREYIYGNKERISQVFTNLVTNAVKYSPKDTEIIISSRKKDGEVVIGVQDFGLGISKDQQKRIFDRFYQADQHKSYAGLGLGLYITSEIIKQHGGKIWVESSKGKGSTFYVSLPIHSKQVN